MLGGLCAIYPVLTPAHFGAGEHEYEYDDRLRWESPRILCSLAEYVVYVVYVDTASSFRLGKATA